LGATLFDWGQGVAARHALERARALNANDEGVYLNLARVSLNAADADDALTWLAVGFDDALWRTRASAAQALALRGLAHAQRADWREARADLEAARALVPDQPDALTGLGALGDSGR
jgi:Flp pilus assembly protein TadD